VTTWYLIRSLGLVAYLLFSLTLALGAASTTSGATGEAIDRRVVRQLLHRSVAVLALGALAAHLVLVVLDSFVPTTLPQVLVPMTATYRPFALALGTVAMYSLVLAAVSGWARAAIASTFSEPAWRRVHHAAYVGWALCLGHGILAGTDSPRHWSWAVYAAGVVLVAGALSWRRASSRRRAVVRGADGRFRTGAMR
jgi:sulfoxide reductase heme-binding subunit YedZ